MRAEGRASSDAGPSYRDAKAEKIARLIYEAGQPSITARIAILLTGGGDGRVYRSGGTEAGGVTDDEIAPRRRLQAIAVAAFHWTPEQFWNSTPYEFYPSYGEWRELLKATSPHPLQF
jgi:hypothetical protein